MSTVESNADAIGRNWCAICSTMLGSTALLLIGFSMLIRGLGTTGLVLVFVGGGILVLSICAAAGKCKMDPIKETTGRYEDRPPSYRTSWRGSFLRRHRIVNLSNTDTELVEVSHITSEPQSNNTEAAFNNTLVEQAITEVVPLHTTGISSTTMPSYVPASQGGQAQQAPSDCLVPNLGSTNTRHALSLSNIVDLPTYETAIASMDEGSLRKLKSEIYLPSVSNH